MSETIQTRRSRRLAVRSERQRLAERGRLKARQRGRILWLAAGLAVCVALALGIYLILQSAIVDQPGQSLPADPREHVPVGAGVSYRTNPPASGPHYDQWIPRGGFFTDPQPSGLWIHNLEHGYIVVLYNCSTDCPDLVAQLRGFYEAAPNASGFGYRKLVVTPYREMSQRLVAVAWARMEQYDEFDQDRLMRFYRAWVNKGPEQAP